MIHILIVDDHPSVIEGTKGMIEQEDDMVVTVATSGMKALELLDKETFDILLIDLNMPGISGLELTRRVMAINSDTPILIYTGYDINPHFNLLVEAGISGFISKTATRDQLVITLRCALNREAVIPMSLFRQLRRKEIKISTTEDGTSMADVSINEREQLILLEISKGKSNKEIAESLLLSTRTVEYSLTGIFGKLNVRSRAEAILEAKRLGIIY